MITKFFKKLTSRVIFDIVLKKIKNTNLKNMHFAIKPKETCYLKTPASQ